MLSSNEQSETLKIIIKLGTAYKAGERGIDLFELDAEHRLKITLGEKNRR